jgi:hypothetical protein
MYQADGTVLDMPLLQITEVHVMMVVAFNIRSLRRNELSYECHRVDHVLPFGKKYGGAS